MARRAAGALVPRGAVAGQAMRCQGRFANRRELQSAFAVGVIEHSEDAQSEDAGGNTIRRRLRTFPIPEWESPACLDADQ